MKKPVFFMLILLPVVVFFTTCSMVSGPAKQKKAEVEVSTVVDMTDDPWNIPAYNANIVWQADTRVVRHLNMSLFDGYVYMFDDEYYGGDARFVLTKIDAETGAIMWKTPLEEPRCMQITEPLVSGKYVFAFQDEDIDNNPADILMYDNNNGTLLAKVLLAPPGKETHIYDNAIVHDGFLYFGYRNMELDESAIEHFLGRLDIAKINPTLGGDTIQNIQPEVMWTPQTKRKVWAKPLVHNNTIYCMTFSNEYIEWDGGTFDPPVEVAGIDMNSKNVVFYKTINYDTGLLTHPFLIHGDILYILGYSFSAYNLKTGEQLYMHRFKWGQDLKDTYDAAPYSYGGTYYKGNIYYTNTASGSILTDTSRNIIGVDAATGKLAYRDMPLNSESLQTNPIIAHDKMYVPYMNGLRVYDLTTHKIVGEDPLFYGFATGHNLLYKDYMITFLRDTKLYGGGAKVVAVYVGE